MTPVKSRDISVRIDMAFFMIDMQVGYLSKLIDALREDVKALKALKIPPAKSDWEDDAPTVDGGTRADGGA